MKVSISKADLTCNNCGCFIDKCYNKLCQKYLENDDKIYCIGLNGLRYHYCGDCKNEAYLEDNK